MSIIRSAIRSSPCLRPLDRVINRSSIPFLYESRKCLSTGTEQQPPSTFPLPPPPGTSPGAGIPKPSSGEEKYYGKFSGFTKHTLKTDIMNILDGSNLTPDDLKFNYTRGGGKLHPAAVYVQFPTLSAYDSGLRGIARKGKLYKLERATRSQWDPISPYEGKVVALYGIPQNAFQDDIDRFLSGCLYIPGSIQFITSQALGGPKKVALVRFTSQTQAMNAYIAKNRSFLLNNQISMQVLQ